MGFSTDLSFTSEKPDNISDSPHSFFLPKGENRQGEGGLRTRGNFKRNNDRKLLISIITVVYNGEKFLEETILSTLNQTYDNVEYIIIDGGSTDGTLDIIRKYENAIDYWVSEKDYGIYDAMNKGIDLVTGDWINFMNAGDKFYNENVLKEVFSKNSYDKYHFIFGDTSVNYGNFTKRVNADKNFKNFYRGMPFCHQSVFVQTEYHRKNKFDIDYKIAADFNLAYQAFLEGCHFTYERNIISEVITGGISFNLRSTTYNEYKNIVLKRKHNFKHLFYYRYILIYTQLKTFIKKILPESVILYLQKSN